MNNRKMWNLQSHESYNRLSCKSVSPSGATEFPNISFPPPPPPPPPDPISLPPPPPIWLSPPNRWSFLSPAASWSLCNHFFNKSSLSAASRWLLSSDNVSSKAKSRFLYWPLNACIVHVSFRHTGWVFLSFSVSIKVAGLVGVPHVNFPLIFTHFFIPIDCCKTQNKEDANKYLLLYIIACFHLNHYVSSKMDKYV